MSAAVERPATLDTVADNFTAAVRAVQRQRMDGAFKTIKDVGLSL